MKKKLLLVALLGLSKLTNAQEAKVEKSVFGVQTGYLGLWVNNESRLADKFVIRTEVGFDAGFWANSFYDQTGFLMAPVLIVEPKYYYNMAKRLEKGRNISDNAANYLSIKTSYHPDWFVVSNYDNINVISDISIIPSWGIRRNLGKNFNYELGLGLGVRYIFAKQAGYAENEINLADNISFKIGYKF
ncbi:hypothetical protein [Pedobacter heparinus]|uniref:Outer membrane protein beta-barrel domain-containing protein n=1 Tax=Pedobacter heparinus (strain ATCC 13125 / DSM 2366 / CIP 104194 / JCM 7457 / NBRC 12017 / NCIMB 9290 / NRRL B-14731 / HIM 762-3) TaxID=485917 RepID=C6Y2Y1_PEDHD|nr:hypothetical protein [Pedobacter heparinus]ACU03194.1 hypothetical protein Phep_0972 [Pedobacter heparinus DSM 2366]